ncbi:hypothetical protein ACQP2P_01230 [Dactylosporangium sp. CA-139114]|uniref:hypothetical protein n=1 Tax=Dactylosporangium sp. CA-139114 TaxID=3239931 RepID=UPI003D980589
MRRVEAAGSKAHARSRTVEGAPDAALEAPTAEARTAEARTAEARTAEARTAEARTAEARTFEGALEAACGRYVGRFAPRHIGFFV